MSTTQPSNFMSKIPHEIHGEIFAHCIPRNPFRLDPDAYYYDDSSDEGTYDQYALRPQHINVSRVLRLGHVCRLWREIVLETASLWTHLDYCLHILQTNSDLKPKWAVLKSDIEFIRWWKAKHRLIPPFICLKANVTFQNHKAEANWDLNGLDVILEYLTTAQFLEIDRFFWERFEEWVKLGNRPVFRNLHTLMSTKETVDSLGSFLHAHEILGLVPNRPASVLRRLAIDLDTLTQDAIPNHWSTLTEISCSDITISLSFWNSLIRAVPLLQKGFFILSMRSKEYKEPVRCVLPDLKALYVSITDKLKPTLLFAHLRLPALHTLYIYSSSPHWKQGEYAIPELNTILMSMPNIEMLALGDKFLALESHNFDAQILSEDTMEPFWRFTQRLLHLELGTDTNHAATPEKARKQFTNFLQNVFFPGNRWLGLERQACPIRRITIISDNSKIKDFVESSVLKIAKTIPKIDVGICENSASRKVCCEPILDWAVRKRQ